LRAWLAARNYCLCDVAAGEVEREVAAVLDRLATALGLDGAAEGT
jgi:hypothetical protein